MSRFLPLLLLALPASAEWLSFEINFQGTGCTSCAESLPARLQRMRGVESAQVDVSKGVLTMKLAAGNRVRLELVRDQIEQDGTKVKSARLHGSGTVAQEAGKWTFRLAGLDLSYPLEIPPGAATLEKLRAQPQAVQQRTFTTAALRPTPVLRLAE